MVGAEVLWAVSTRSPNYRCAVYTRKSTDEGLDQAFNSLDAQRDACVAYIASQGGLGWTLVPDRYDDGGISGGTMGALPCSGFWKTFGNAGSMSWLL